MNIVQWIILLFAKKSDNHPPELWDYEDVNDWSADYNDWLKYRRMSSY